MRPAVVPVTLAASERTILKQRARGAKTPYRDRLRAQIVLGAARGRDNARIAAGLGICVNTVRKWRGRSASLITRGRPARGRSLSPATTAPVNRPRPVGSVFTQIPRPAAIRVNTVRKWRGRFAECGL